jgi:hypothetical protein
LRRNWNRRSGLAWFEDSHFEAKKDELRMRKEGALHIKRKKCYTRMIKMFGIEKGV